MKKKFDVILLQMIIILMHNAFGFLDTDIIGNYFNEKFIKYGTVMGCFNKSEENQLSREFTTKGRLMSVVNINEIKSIKHLLTSKHNHIGVVLDADCRRSKEVLKQCGEYNYFDVKHHWLITSSNYNIKDIFKNVKVYINADIHIAIPSANHTNGDENIIIFDFYNPSYDHGGVNNFTQLGYYNKLKGYNGRIKESKYWIRRNMTGVTFNVMIVLPEPFEGTLSEYLENDNNRQINTFNRFHSSVMHVCQKYYNFNMNIKLSKSWGYVDRDGTFDGLVGSLERKEADFGLSPLFVREDRAQYMEYGRLTWVLRAAFIFRNPKLKTSVEIFLEPLSTSTWILTLLSGTIGIVALKISLIQEKKNLNDVNLDTSWSLLLIQTIGAMCQQGITKTPKLLSGRIITLFLFLLFLLIYQFYSASIVSHLLMKVSSTIKTIQDILLSTMEVGCEDILYNRDYFLYTTDKPSRELYFKKVLRRYNRSNFLPAREGIQLVEKGNYAFHVELATAYPIIEKKYGMKEICELKEVQMYKTQPMHANMQKHSPFRDMIDTCLQRLAENGILHREIKHWHPRKPECIQNSNSKTFNVGLEDFYPALMAMAIGLTLSLFTLTVEIYVSKKNKKAVVKNNSTYVYPFIK